MNTCKTCVHWKEVVWPSEVLHECKSEKIAEDCGQKSPESDDMLIYSYYEGGGFYPGPDFGCIHHKTVSLSTDK
jgi:hypothetical protein